MIEKTLKDFHIGQPFFCHTSAKDYYEVTIHATYVKDAILSNKGLFIIREGNYKWPDEPNSHPNSIITSLEEITPYLNKNLVRIRNLTDKDIMDALVKGEMIACIFYNQDRSYVNIRFAEKVGQEESLSEGVYAIYQSWGSRAHKFKLKEEQLNNTKYLNMPLHKEELGNYYSTSYEGLYEGLVEICKPHFSK
jgi:hypothetical protein